jgi:modification methylase
VMGNDHGSIHKMGASVQNAPTCNGWTFWHVDTGSELRVIDAFRQDWLLAHEA